MAACSTLSSVAAALLSAPRLLTGAAMAGAVNAAAPASAPAAAIARTSLRILFSPLVSAPLFIFTQFPGTINGGSTKIRLRLPTEGEQRLGVGVRGPTRGGDCPHVCQAASGFSSGMAATS